MTDIFTKLQEKIKNATTEKEKRNAENDLDKEIDITCKPIIKKALSDFSDEDRKDILAKFKDEVFVKKIQFKGEVAGRCEKRCIDFVRKNKNKNKNTKSINDTSVELIDENNKDNAELKSKFNLCDANLWKEFTENLSKENRDIICSDIYRYKYCEEISHKEIAIKLGIHKNYVEDRLAKREDNRIWCIFKKIIEKIISPH